MKFTFETLIVVCQEERGKYLIAALVHSDEVPEKLSDTNQYLLFHSEQSYYEFSTERAALEATDKLLKDSNFNPANWNQF